MKFCRFGEAGSINYGIVELVGDRDCITRVIAEHPCTDGVLLPPDPEKAERLPLPIDLSRARLLTPTAPSKIVCIGRNYKEHAKELGNEVPPEPLIFLKPPSALLDPGGEIRRPAKLSQRVDYEGELGVVIGKTCRHVRQGEDVREYILGYTCVNDVTARDLQKKDGQWSRAKGFDTFCPYGPVIQTELDPWKGVRVQTRLNGEVKQDGTTADLFFPIDVLIRYISSVMTLYAGDLIASGTPAGIGPMQAGDMVEVEIEGIGKLVNPVVND